MSSPIIDPMDTRRLIWIMDDETYSLLLELTKQHLKLAREGIEPCTSPERKAAIQDEIKSIRLQRDAIINTFITNNTND